MIKPSRPVLWLAFVFAAGIMLVPQRGAARTNPHVFYEPIPEPRLGEPDDPGSGRALRLPAIEFMPGNWWSYALTTYLASNFASERSAKASRQRGQK